MFSSDGTSNADAGTDFVATVTREKSTVTVSTTTPDLGHLTVPSDSESELLTPASDGLLSPEIILAPESSDVSSSFLSSPSPPPVGFVADALDLNTIGEADARKLMSKEHKALGYRPPPGSIAAQAQAAAAKHPQSLTRADSDILTLAALDDAARISMKPASRLHQGVDLDSIGEAEARKLVSIEHRALGYNPPRGSLAAEAQRAAAKHPEGKSGKEAEGKADAASAKKLDEATLIKAALDDAVDIEERNALARSLSPNASGGMTPDVNLVFEKAGTTIPV